MPIWSTGQRRAADQEADPMDVECPAAALAPLQKVTPRQQAVADQLCKKVSPVTTSVLDDGGDVVPLVNPIEEDVLIDLAAGAAFSNTPTFEKESTSKCLGAQASGAGTK